MRAVRWMLMTAFLLCASVVRAQAPDPTFAGKTIRLVVQFPAGGVPDSLARLIAHRLGENLAATVVVDNRPGGTGAVAASVVKSAAPDGLTLLLADSSTYSIAPFLKALPYDPVKDFEPVSITARSMVVLVSNPARVGSVKDLIALARNQPGIAYASSGIGSAHHLAMEMFKARAGLDMLHIPYKGASESLPAVISGDAVAAFSGLNTARSYEKAGRLKILATVTGQRSKLAPEVPTFAEVGLPGLEMSLSFGLFAPLKTPPAVIKRLSDELIKISSSPAFGEQIAVAGLEPQASSPAQLRELIEREQKAFRDVITTAGIKAD